MKTPQKPKAILVDHDDSFTQNLKWWLMQNFSIEVLPYTLLENFVPATEVKLMVLSAGPKSPLDYSKTLNWLKKNPTMPALGICLGFQLMTMAENGRVEKYAPVQHGKTSQLIFTNHTTRGFHVARYHSLECFCPAVFNIIACSGGDQKIMWAEHQSKPWLGWQFHPESFLTNDQGFLMTYLLKWLEAQ